MFLGLRLGNYNFRALLIFTKPLTATMIIGTSFLERQVRSIRCMAGVVWTARGTARTLKRHRPTVMLIKPVWITRGRRIKKPPDSGKEALSRSSMQAAHEIGVPLMTQVPVNFRCKLTGLFHTEPQAAQYVNLRLGRNISIHEIDPDKPFIVFLANFSKVL